MIVNEKQECEKKPEECPVGQTRAPDGSCTGDDEKNKCPSGQAKGKDGTCKTDADGDGKPDDEKDNDDGKQFGGGDDCNAPPTCGGDSIMCGQARIQWRIDCNTRKNASISGGDCSNVPICTGDGCKVVEYKALLFQWRTACATEKLLAKSGTDTGGNTGTTPMPDTTGVPDSALAAQVIEDVQPKDAFSDESGYAGQPGGVPGANGLDTQGYGWSRSCPTPPTVNLMGQSITFDITPFCNWMALGGWLVLIFASFLSVRILSSSSSGSV